MSKRLYGWRKTTPRRVLRDRLPRWLDQFIPPGEERPSTIKMLRLRYRNGEDPDTLSLESGIPLTQLHRLCRFHAGKDPCPKHDGSGLSPCSPNCVGCQWETELILRLGPVPPAIGMPVR
jgi:hypothetical protein